MGLNVTKALDKVKEGATEKKEETVKRMATLIEALKNKVEDFESRAILARGQLGAENLTEVGGGRTVVRQKVIRVSTGSGVDDDINKGIEAFFSIAQGNGLETEDDENTDRPKDAAVEGAKKVLSAGLNALLGASEGQSMEQTSFVVLFLNLSFVRVDYYMYSYVASGKRWGAQDSESGMCYVADMSVLAVEDLKPEEINFLLGQTMAAKTDKELKALKALKIALIRQAIFARMLTEPKMSHMGRSTPMRSGGHKKQGDRKGIIAAKKEVAKAYNMLQPIKAVD